MSIPRTKSRNEARAIFTEHFKDAKTNVQFGARGSKFGDNWTAIDLFDTGDLIDHQWDIHALPIADGTADSVDCNAVLEHVVDPHLAVYELHRIMRKGGLAWIEVPFLQYYHAIPYDFCRWTVQGLELLLEDFEIVRSGVGVNISHEVAKIHDYMAKVFKVDEAFLASNVRSFLQDYEKRREDPRLYSTSFCLVRKVGDGPPEKRDYMEFRKARYAEERPTAYDWRDRLSLLTA